MPCSCAKRARAARNLAASTRSRWYLVLRAIDIAGAATETVASMSRTQEPMSVRAFRQALEERLATRSANELRAILRGMAGEITPTERRAFLACLESGTDTAVVPKQDLLEAIRRLAGELKAAMKHAEYWEDQGEWLDEEDTLGPYAKLVPPVAALFDRAKAVFESGDLPLTRAAYQELFALLELEDDYGRGIRDTDLEGVDRREAVARYLRAVYHTTAPAQRSAVLFECLCRAKSWLDGPRPMVEEIVRVSTRRLPSHRAFLEEWIAFLHRQSGPDADAWLREAVGVSGGAAGLAQLARTAGRKHPRAYLDWLLALEQKRKAREALTAAREALGALRPGLPIRAAIADRLCAAAARVHDQDALRAGRWEAFAAKPDIERLLDLRDVAGPGAERTRNMRQAARHLQDYLRRRPGAHPAEAWEVWEDAIETPAWPGRSTVAHAHLLAGDWKAAHTLASRDRPLGWSSNESAQGLVATVFLVLLSGKPPEALPRNLRELWRWALGNSIDVVMREGEDHERLRDRLDGAYAQALSEASPAADEQARLLTWCQRVTRARVNAIRRPPAPRQLRQGCGAARCLRGGPAAAGEAGGSRCIGGPGTPPFSPAPRFPAGTERRAPTDRSVTDR